MYNIILYICFDNIYKNKKKRARVLTKNKLFDKMFAIPRPASYRS